jgi:hypothetical protein
MTALQTEFDFTLPRGYLASTGQVYQDGQMRLATALDEIEAIHDPRVMENEAYLPVILLSRVIIRLGELTTVTPQVIEKMFASDLAFLEDLYMRFNSQENVILGVVCPHCSTHFEMQVSPLGSSEA